MKMIQLESKKFVSIMAIFFAILFGIMANGCGGGGGGGDTYTPPPPTVEAPGVPTNFMVDATPNALSATLTWSAPTTGGEPTSYEIYRSTTANNIFDPANHLTSLPATANEFIDDAGLDYGVTYYWIVVAKNDGGETPTLPADLTFVEAPGAPENLAIAGQKGHGMLTLTLTWEKPLTGDAPTSYEVYRSDSNVGVFDPANHYVSLSADTFTFSENAGMEDNTSYWVVSAMNAAGETPAGPVAYTSGSAGGTGEIEGFGNNFAAAMIFADGYGISGLQLDPSKSWTTDVDPLLMDFNTGLRPTSTQVFAAGTLLPYLDENTTHLYTDGVLYYKQQTDSTWQGEWINGENEDQNVTAKWGDNLVSQTKLTTNSVIRIEMGLTKALDTNMTTYKMQHLYGEGMNEMWGTDGTEVNTTTAFVFAVNAHLIIQHVDGLGNPIGDPVDDQTLFDSSVPDGPGKFGAEINVGGNLTYGYVWDLKKKTAPAGRYKITFKLDDTSVPTGTPNNTFIDHVANGEYVSPTEAYIIINIAQQ